ncbi:MAG: hypothetical protein EP343_01045 [Deltaproteobacteria bacterium]|nr:MAG: hypothetical protein EP343_01045 [Deltaproteobacteria bacterium]
MSQKIQNLLMEIRQALKRGDSSVATTRLLELLQDSEPANRRYATETLGELGQGAEPAIPALVEAFKDEDMTTRKNAVRALGKIGVGQEGPQVLTVLQQALQHTDDSIRSEAAWALVTLGDQAHKAIPQLLEAFQDQVFWVKVSAIQALGKILVEGDSSALEHHVLDTLLQAQHDSDSEVRKVVGKVLDDLRQSAHASTLASYEAYRKALAEKKARQEMEALQVERISSTKLRPPTQDSKAWQPVSLSTPSSESESQRIAIPLRKPSSTPAPYAHANDATLLGVPSPARTLATKKRTTQPKPVAAAQPPVETKPPVEAKPETSTQEETQSVASVGPDVPAPTERLTVPTTFELPSWSDVTQTQHNVQPTQAEVQAVSIAQDLGDSRTIIQPSPRRTKPTHSKDIRPAETSSPTMDPVAMLMQSLNSPQDSARRDAIQTLGALKTRASKALTALSEVLLLDQDPRIRADAAEAIGQIGQQLDVSIPSLVMALQDTHALVKMTAVEALGQFGSQAKPAVPALVQALHDPNNEIRSAAADTLGEIGERAAVPGLKRALQDDNNEVREAAADALAQIGEEDS